jgi:biotin carboxyl carrier protein
VEYRYEFGGQSTTVQVEAEAEGYLVTVGERAYRVKAGSSRPGELALVLGDEQRCLAWVASDGASRWVALGSGEAAGQTFVLTVPETGPKPRRAHTAEHKALEAQMPGIVRRVLVAEGEQVSRGQALVLLEAMKMEIRVSAPQAGRVVRVAVTPGQAVERGQALVELSNLPVERE